MRLETGPSRPPIDPYKYDDPALETGPAERPKSIGDFLRSLPWKQSLGAVVGFGLGVALLVWLLTR